MEADDGGFYVVKFLNNPQHRRILVNELVASVFLRYLQLATPPTASIEITPELLRETPQLGLDLGSRKIPVEPGIHFGSRFPGDPDRLAVYDFLPDVLLGQVHNLSHFLGALVFDKWAGNADSRQAIFFRARPREWDQTAGQPAGNQPGFVALLIDNGFVFNGPHWDFPDSALQGLYIRKRVYEPVRSLDDFQPWLEQIIHFPEAVIDEAYKQTPPQWVQGDQESFDRLLERLWKRRARAADLIRECRKAKVTPFPHWT